MNKHKTTSIDLNEKARQVQRYVHNSVTNAIKIGKVVAEVKSAVSKQVYKQWITDSFGWSNATAWRFIQVSERFDKYENYLNNFDLSAVYALSSPSVSSEAITKALEASKKSRVTQAVAKQIIGETTNKSKPQEKNPSNKLIKAELVTEEDSVLLELEKAPSETVYLPLPEKVVDNFEPESDNINNFVIIKNGTRVHSVGEACNCLNLQKDFCCELSFVEMAGFSIEELLELDGVFLSERSIIVYKGQVENHASNLVLFKK